MLKDRDYDVYIWAYRFKLEILYAKIWIFEFLFAWKKKRKWLREYKIFVFLVLFASPEGILCRIVNKIFSLKKHSVLIKHFMICDLRAKFESKNEKKSKEKLLLPLKTMLFFEFAFWVNVSNYVIVMASTRVDSLNLSI